MIVRRATTATTDTSAARNRRRTSMVDDYLMVASWNGASGRGILSGPNQRQSTRLVLHTRLYDLELVRWLKFGMHVLLNIERRAIV